MRSDDVLHVAIVTPVVHYCMGGLRMSPESEVVNQVIIVSFLIDILF